MNLVPSGRQFYPTTTFLDSFHSTTFKRQFTVRLLFLRYGSSFPSPLPLKNLTVCSRRDEATPNSVPDRRSPGKININRNRNFGVSPEEESSFSQGINVVPDSSGKNWLHKWTTPKSNRPRPPRETLNYRSRSNGNVSVGGEAGTTMERIVEKLRKFGYIDDERKGEERRVIEKGSIEDIFYVEDGMLPNSRGGFSEDSPLGMEPGFGIESFEGEAMFPWEKPIKKEDENPNSYRQKSRTHLAELTLPESELRRLKNLTLRIKNKMRITAGVTQEVVDKIKDKWNSEEIVRLKIEGPSALNMKRMHEILERKTGGLVIWRSGSSVALYRGVSYQPPSAQKSKWENNRSVISRVSHNVSDVSMELKSAVDSHVDQVVDSHVDQVDERESMESRQKLEYEDEIDKLLEGLGPRYTDWPGDGPLPVDADLLPGIVPSYRPPFRVLPYGVRFTLSIKEATALRRLARVLPPHFALGRSRQHQGLALAMIKLWENSSIAKVALKRGVQLTVSERMAEDIKKLTGSLLLSRNKDFLVFYRGKDFLSPEVAEALLEKERLAITLQDEEEQARLRASASITHIVDKETDTEATGTLSETMNANARWGKTLDVNDKAKVMQEAEVTRHTNLVRKLEYKLAFAERKVQKAEKALAKVEQSLCPSERKADPDSITDEERFMFRKLGLRMKAFLLLGRRGVFDGTVENMHLHWKYRELVKIIVKAKNFEHAKKISLSLEAESGGVLVSVDKISKGYGIIVYRGKNYQRPTLIRPKNLLTKRKALARSIELQRREALLHHISTLQTRADKIRSEIREMAKVRGFDNEELYDKLDSAYPTDDDEDSEVEGDVEAHLETYETEDDDKEDEDEDENENSASINVNDILSEDDEAETFEYQTSFRNRFSIHESETGSDYLNFDVEDRIRETEEDDVEVGLQN